MTPLTKEEAETMPLLGDMRERLLGLIAERDAALAAAARLRELVQSAPVVNRAWEDKRDAALAATGSNWLDAKMAEADGAANSRFVQLLGCDAAHTVASAISEHDTKVAAAARDTFYASVQELTGVTRSKQDGDMQAAVARHDARVAAEARAPLLKALKAVERWLHDADNPGMTFERLAEDFYRETGFMRPGKDSAAAAHQDPLECDIAWSEWRVARAAKVLAECRAAIALAEGGAKP